MTKSDYVDSRSLKGATDAILGLGNNIIILGKETNSITDYY